MTATCSACPAALGPRNQSGRCRRCTAAIINTDPAIAERRRLAIRRKFEDPEFRAAHIARVVETMRHIPERERERRRTRGRVMAATVLRSPEVLAKLSCPALRAENGRKRSETALAWCPPDWREKYRDLKKRGRRAAQAKAIVLGLIAGKSEPELYAEQKQQLAWCPLAWRSRYHSLRSRYRSVEARRRVLSEIAQAELRALSVEAAVEFLRPFAPIYRCTAEGTLASYGGFWRYGRAVLDRAGVIERAAQRGWPPAAVLTSTITNGERTC